MSDQRRFGHLARPGNMGDRGHFTNRWGRCTPAQLTNQDPQRADGPKQIRSTARYSLVVGIHPPRTLVAARTRVPRTNPRSLTNSHSFTHLSYTPSFVYYHRDFVCSIRFFRVHVSPTIETFVYVKCTLAMMRMVCMTETKASLDPQRVHTKLRLAAGSRERDDATLGTQQATLPLYSCPTTLGPHHVQPKTRQLVSTLAWLTG